MSWSIRMVTVHRIQVKSNQNNMTMDLAKSVNTTYEYGPPRTIHGIPIDVFSYIFLVIGCTAPVIFIIAFAIVTKCYKWKRAKRRQSYRAQVRRIAEFEKFHSFSKRDSYRTSTPIDSSSLPRSTHYGYGTENSRSPLVLVSLTPTKSISSTVISSDSNPNVYFKRPSSEDGDEATLENQRPHRRSNRDSGISVLGSSSSISGACNGYVTHVLVTQDDSVINYSNPRDDLRGERFSEIMHISNNEGSNDRAEREVSPAETDPGLGMDEDSSVGEANKEENKSRTDVKLHRPISMNSEEAQVLAAFDQIYQDFSTAEGTAEELLTGPVNNLSEDSDAFKKDRKLPGRETNSNNNSILCANTDLQRGSSYEVTSIPQEDPAIDHADNQLNSQGQFRAFNNGAFVGDSEAEIDSNTTEQYFETDCIRTSPESVNPGVTGNVSKDKNTQDEIKANGGLIRQFSNCAFSPD